MCVLKNVLCIYIIDFRCIKKFFKYFFFRIRNWYYLLSKEYIFEELFKYMVI